MRLIELAITFILSLPAHPFGADINEKNTSDWAFNVRRRPVKGVYIKILEKKIRITVSQWSI